MRRWSVLVLTVAVPVLFLLFAIFGSSQSHAVSGCCKERGSYKGEWYRSGKSLRECRKANFKKDKDNLLDPQGLVWWDVNCR